MLIDKHPHELNLLFVSPYEDQNVAFECDECHGIANRDNWVYYCARCDFGMHSNCTTGNVTGKEAANSSQSGHEHLMDSVSRQVEDIQAFNEAQETLAAARLAAKINARGRKAILDMIDDSGPRRDYSYY
ncbi:Hypothetical predicted protein [Olea europaea subsp. europaea]|uniref:DC1 domain-containing protein n=1 Tax=Olea europaea subsp. europaea TaxID=158383 RepID=A0A8S0QDG1_OLEEU|nr:Hypothetical predicted protein [Olea europaea subsp. europaea]